MSSNKIYLTKQGLEKLKQELTYLCTKKRKEIIKKIQEAKEYGDLSENTEYESAKNEQAFVEGRISEIKQILKNAVVIKQEGKKPNIVCLGSTIIVEIDGEKEEYIIVGSLEADPEKGKISNESKVGEALLGKKVGDKVKVQVPDGTIEYKILEIK